MSVLTGTQEKLIREALKARAQKPGVLGSTFPVFTKRVYISSEQDLVKKIGVKVGNKIEFKYLQIELAGIDDGEGEDNCPIVEAKYRFHLFVGFVDSRSGGATYESSTEEFNSLYLNLRNEFSINDRVFPDSDNTRNDALTRVDFIVIDEDPLTGATGHFIDLETTVEYT